MAQLLKPPSLSWLQILDRTWDGIFGPAAQLSYYFLLSLFPMLICMVTVLGVFSASGNYVREELVVVARRMLPSGVGVGPGNRDGSHPVSHCLQDVMGVAILAVVGVRGDVCCNGRTERGL